MDAERIYRRLPVPLQELAVAVEGARLQRRRYGGDFEAIAAEYREREKASADEVRRFRDERLRHFVIHAARTVPYWRSHFQESGVDPAAIRELGDLSILPVLDRETVRASPERFRSEAAGPTTEARTSGTTGAGLRFPLTIRAEREQWAVWWRYRRGHGIGPHEPCLYFGGRTIVPAGADRPPFWRRNRPARQTIFSAYHLGPETAPFYLEEMRRTGARWIHGYPSVVSLLASYVVAADERLPVRWVTTGAESLLPHQEAAIEEAFGVRPVEHYGVAEGAANLSMCPEERRLHIDEDFAAVELVPIEDGASGAGTHRIVGTNLSNAAFPLLRYDVGDVATHAGAICGCGRPGRVVDRVDGRVEDVVVARDGTRLGRLDHIFKGMTRIREAQIRQEEAGRMTVCVVRATGYGAGDEAKLRGEIEARLGTRIEYSIEYEERLPRGPGGKLRLVVSRADPA